MGRRRRDRGAAGVEYIGVFLVVAVSLAAGTAMRPDLGHTITHGIERGARCAVAILFGTACPSDDSDDGGGDHDEPGETPPTGYPTTGPPIEDGLDLDGLPWPGEWHVGVSNDGPLQGRITVGERMGSCRLDEDGDPYVELSVTNDLRLTGELDGKNVDLSAFTDRELRYTISTDPETAAEISEGGEGPQPVDPRSIPVGTAVTLDETFYEGTGLSGSYRALQAQLEYSSGRRVSSGIERIDATHVRINVGDSDVVAETIGLGLGSEDLVAGLNGMNSSEDGKMTSVDVDISTPHGWAAYQSFLTTGQLPRAGSKGVSSLTHADFSEWKSRQELGLKVEDLGLSWTIQDIGGREVTTHNADGSTSYSWVVDQKDDVTIVRSAATGVNGETTAKSRSFQLKDVDGTLLSHYLDDAGGEGSGGGGEEDVTLTFTDDQLDGMQQAALEQLANSAELTGQGEELWGDDVSAEEVADWLEEFPDGEGLGWRGSSNVIDIANAKTPDDVFDELTDETTDAEDLVQFLWDFGNGTVEALHGISADPEDHPEDFAGGTVTRRPTGC